MLKKIIICLFITNILSFSNIIENGLSDKFIKKINTKYKDNYIKFNKYKNTFYFYFEDFNYKTAVELYKTIKQNINYEYWEIRVFNKKKYAVLKGDLESFDIDNEEEYYKAYIFKYNSESKMFIFYPESILKKSEIKFDDKELLKNIYYIDDIKFDSSQVAFLKKNNKKINGIVIESFNNGVLHKKLFYENGKQNKTSYIYYGNGNINCESNFNNGIMDGKYLCYFPTGKIKQEYLVKNQEIEGIAKTYYENGNINLLISYKNGTLDGYWITFDEKGNISSKIKYKNNEVEIGE